MQLAEQGASLVSPSASTLWRIKNNCQLWLVHGCQGQAGQHVQLLLGGVEVSITLAELAGGDCEFILQAGRQLVRLHLAGEPPAHTPAGVNRPDQEAEEPAAAASGGPGHRLQEA